MPYTLVVVDMQSNFSAANRPNTVIGVTKEILKAVKDKAPIIFLEYQGCAATHEAYLKLVRNYPKVSRITKPTDDGSSEVIRTLARRKFYSKRLRVCGVNTDCCVEATVRGLLRKSSSKIEVVKEACGAGNEWYDWRNYHRHANLKLV